MDQPSRLASFCLFLSFRTENFSSQQDSNSHSRSSRQGLWPLDHHHHGPASTFFQWCRWLDQIGAMFCSNRSHWRRNMTYQRGGTYRQSAARNEKVWFRWKTKVAAKLCNGNNFFRSNESQSWDASVFVHETSSFKVDLSKEPAYRMLSSD